MTKIPVTEYLAIELDTENYHCRVCDHEMGSSRKSYKEALLVHQRDPREIHKPILDPEKYEFTFAPDPKWVQILEYYCSSCGTMMEVEYLPPGMPPSHDIDFNIDLFKERWKGKKPLAGIELAGPDLGGLAAGTHNKSKKQKAGR